MLGLMQDRPLNIPMIVGHAERMHARKTVTTRVEHGVVVTPVGQVLERARRLVAALRALGVREGDRVATFAWNTQQHLEAYVGVPCLGAILHTLVTGRPPMSGAVARRYRRVPTARLAPAVPRLEPSLRSVLLAALARDPRHRPATAGDLAALLERVGRESA